MARPFGKLYEEDAHNLANAMAMLPRKSMARYADLLLTCYSMLRRDDDPPHFRAGYRDLAARCGCDKMTAKRFLDLMEADGIIVKVGTATVRRKDGGGEYTKRAFWWHLDEGGVSRNAYTPVRIPGETHTGVYAHLGGNAYTPEAELQKGRIAARPLLGARLAPADEDDDGTPTDENGDVLMPWEVGADG